MRQSIAIKLVFGMMLISWPNAGDNCFVSPRTLAPFARHASRTVPSFSASTRSYPPDADFSASTPLLAAATAYAT